MFAAPLPDELALIATFGQVSRLLGFSKVERPLVLATLAHAAKQLAPDTFVQWVTYLQEGEVTTLAAYTRQALHQAALPVRSPSDEDYARLLVCCGFLAIHQQ